MGNCVAISKNIKRRQICEFIRDFDFNQENGAQFTFAMRFARENTNDKGENLSLGSAQYIIR